MATNAEGAVLAETVSFPSSYRVASEATVDRETFSPTASASRVAWGASPPALAARASTRRRSCCSGSGSSLLDGPDPDDDCRLACAGRAGRHPSVAGRRAEHARRGPPCLADASARRARDRRERRRDCGHGRRSIALRRAALQRAGADPQHGSVPRAAPRDDHVVRDRRGVEGAVDRARRRHPRLYQPVRGDPRRRPAARRDGRRRGRRTLASDHARPFARRASGVPRRLCASHSPTASSGSSSPSRSTRPRDSAS